MRASFSQVEEAVLPWVAGFEFATSIFPALLELPDDAVNLALARLYRFLPPDSDDGDESEAIRQGGFAAMPALPLDAAIDEVAACVGDLYELTAPLRYRVETVRRPTAKVGRNDPCPCGSGRKFKLCHGAR